jgi:hypothetical protein
MIAFEKKLPDFLRIGSSPWFDGMSLGDSVPELGESCHRCLER